MKLSDFDYFLPKELIAQEGLSNRDEARLMVLRPDGSYEHRGIKDLLQFFRKGDLLVLNNTRVLKSKLIGSKESGGKVDCLIVSSPGARSQEPVREALLRGNNIKPGTLLIFKGDGQTDLKGTVTEKLLGTRYKVRFDRPDLISRFATLPLPPYIKKKLGQPDRYQTIYSKEEGSLAAPTAGLHFTSGLMEKLKAAGVEFTYLTLHIGLGTFAPIRTDEVEKAQMHKEYYQISETTAAQINQALKSGRRLFAVGTTTVRAMESSARRTHETEPSENHPLQPGEGWTELLIVPGKEFKIKYSGLLTNFHLPKSTLLLLVSAFSGREKILRAYREAIEQKYRFYSLGDAMLIFKSS